MILCSTMVGLRHSNHMSSGNRSPTSCTSSSSSCTDNRPSPLCLRTLEATGLAKSLAQGPDLAKGLAQGLGPAKGLAMDPPPSHQWGRGGPIECHRVRNTSPGCCLLCMRSHLVDGCPSHTAPYPHQSA